MVFESKKFNRVLVIEWRTCRDINLSKWLTQSALPDSQKGDFTFYLQLPREAICQLNNRAEDDDDVNRLSDQ